MITIEVLKLIDQLEALVSSGTRVPLTSRTVIDEQEFLDIIDRLRVAIPEEIKQAKRLTQERERVLSQSQVEAEDVIASARAQAAQLVGKDELVLTAREQADRLLAEAERSAGEMRDGADSYAAEVLGRLETELNRMLAAVRKGQATLERTRQRTDGRLSQVPSGDRVRDLDR